MKRLLVLIILIYTSALIIHFEVNNDALPLHVIKATSRFEYPSPAKQGGRASSAIDGKFDTWWYGNVNETDPNNLQITFAKPTRVAFVKFYFEDRYPTDFTVYYKVNNEWVKVRSVNGNTNSVVSTDLRSVTQTTAQTKIVFNKTSQEDKVIRISEIIFYGYTGNQWIVSPVRLLLNVLLLIFWVYYTYRLVIFFRTHHLRILLWKQSLRSMREVTTTFLCIIIFLIVSIYPTFINISSLGNGYASPVDSGIPLQPSHDFNLFFSALNGRIAYGYSDTNWQLISKTMPIFVFQRLFNNQEFAVRAYLSFALFITMICMFYFVKKVSKVTFICLAFSIFWVTQEQFMHWLIFTPNVTFVFAGTPLLLGAIYETYRQTYLRKRDVLATILGLIFVVSGDISYSAIVLIMSACFCLVLFLFSNKKLKSTYNMFFIGLSASLFSLIIISGLVSGTIFSGMEQHADKLYSTRAIAGLIKQADPLMGLRLAVEPGPDFNNLIPKQRFSLLITLAVITLSVYLGRRNPLVLSAFILIIIGSILSAGQALPHYQTFYKILYKLPGALILRNLSKFSFLEVFSIFVMFIYVADTLIVRGRPLTKFLFILCIPIFILPFTMASQKFTAKDLRNIYIFRNFPQDYIEAKKVLASADNYRIYYYPLRDPVVTENYTWLSEYKTSTPFIGTFFDRPHNLLIDISRHSLSIDLYNILMDKNRSNGVDVFFRATGSLGYKYIVFRRDLTDEFYPLEAKVNLIEGISAIKARGFSPVVENPTLTVFQIPDEYFVPIVRASGSSSIKSSRLYQHVEVTPNWSETNNVNILVNTVFSSSWVVSTPIIDNWLGRIFVSFDPIIFGKPALFHGIVSERCDADPRVPMFVATARIGNCFRIYKDDVSGANYIVLEYFPDWLTKHLKLAGLIFGIMALNLLFSKRLFNWSNRIINRNDSLDRIFHLISDKSKIIWQSINVLSRKILRILIKLRIWVAVLALLIVAWQVKYTSSLVVSNEYTRRDASGLMIEHARPFIYFYFYKSLYPLRTSYEEYVYSKEGAEKLIKERPENLHMDNSWYIAWGEQGKTLLLLADAYLKGVPKDLSVIPINSILFITSLVLLYLAFEFSNKRGLGLLLIALLGSHRFQVYEVYTNENIFGFAITVMITLLAINLHLIFGAKHKKLAFVSACLSGIILGVMTHIRLETVTLGASCVLVYLTMKNTLPFRKLMLIGILILSFAVSAKSLELYFNKKSDETMSYLKARNVISYKELSSKNSYHTVWHPIFVGFGDFDKKYGFRWDDNSAYDYALPILKERYPQKYASSSDREIITADPRYNAIIRDKVINTIVHDPAWYINIIIQRADALFTKTVPVTLLLPYVNFDVPFKPWLFIPLVLFLTLKRDFELVKILLFSLAISASSIFIQSAHGILYSAAYHYVALAVLIHLLISGLKGRIGLFPLDKQ